MNTPIRKVICAACHCKTYDTVLISPRHWDSTMHKQLALFPEKYKLLTPNQWEQGFVDQFGVFMTRVEAFQVAQTSGQKINHTLNLSDVQLFSEGLY